MELSDDAAPFTTAEIPQLGSRVLRSIPRPGDVWTVGLARNGEYLYESHGGQGDSRLIGYDANFAISHQGRVPNGYYGEGLCVSSDYIFQLTYQDNRVLIWDRSSMAVVDQRPFHGEGWGLCSIGDYFVATDGSHKLRIFDFDWRLVDEVAVQIGGRSIPGLNDISLVGDVLWINRVQTCRLLAVRWADFRVLGEINLWNDFMGGSAPARFGANGVTITSHDATLLVTGKLFERFFEVRPEFP